MTSSVGECELSGTEDSGDITKRVCWKAARGILNTGEGIGVPSNISALGESTICEGCGKRAFFGGETTAAIPGVNFTPPRGCLGPGDTPPAAEAASPAIPHPRPRE